MKKKARLSIACASGFWGDTPWALSQLLEEPELDYVIFDYLSEVTMTILAKQKKRDPRTGYAADFFSDAIEPHLKEVLSRKIKLISNAGGMNPLALKEKIESFAQGLGLTPKIVCVLGDDLLELLPPSVTDMDGHAVSTSSFVSANAYLGAPALTQALGSGADIVLTGRVVDTALLVAPVVHEFAIAWNDFDKLAQASLAGHIVECGTQCCGGNFTDWERVPGRDNIGFPIVRFRADGTFSLTKAAGTGGLISRATVAEQIVYEIGDPRAYRLPDVVCDFSEVEVTDAGKDLVEISGARGTAPGMDYKVCATTVDGWKIAATALVGGEDAIAKGKSVGQAILSRAQRFAHASGYGPFTETLVESLGGTEHALLRISAAHANPAALEILAKEVAPAATSLAPGLANLLGGRAQAMPRIRLVSFLWPKQKVSLTDGSSQFSLPAVCVGAQAALPTETWKHAAQADFVEVPLRRVAYARSGDKGNHVNIGVVARRTEQFSALKSALGAEQVRAYFASDFDEGEGAVEAWSLPGLNALNFLLKNCLGGGGAYSLKADPQGKAFAQRLLAMPIRFPKELL